MERLQTDSGGRLGERKAGPVQRHSASRVSTGPNRQRGNIRNINAISQVMIAIEIRESGGPEVLIPVERPVPRAGPGEVIIKVAAAGVNRADVMQRQGAYPMPPGAPDDIPGLEVSATVAAIGTGVSRC